MGLLGVGSGLGYFTPIKNCWKYYPDSNGLVFGIIVVGLGLSSSILSPLADFLFVNPEQKGTSEDGYYPADVANNLIKFLYALTIIFASLGTIAFLVTFEYKENSEDTKEKLVTDGEEKKEEDKEKETDDKDKKENKKEENQKKDYSAGELFKIFISGRNLKMLSFCICGLCKLNQIKIISNLFIIIYLF